MDSIFHNITSAIMGSVRRRVKLGIISLFLFFSLKIIIRFRMGHY